MSLQSKQPVFHLSRQQLSELLSEDVDSTSIQVIDSSVADHLENCELCRRRLEEAAAEPWLWDSASQILVETFDGETHSESENHLAGTTPAFHRADNEATIDTDIVQSMLDTPNHPEMLGRIDTYEIEAAIGTGGSGVVFKAFDSELNRPVAIKVLSPRYANIGAARKRFSREARAAAAICHENVIAIHQIDSAAKNPFIVMPYVGGGSLQEFVDQQGPLDPVQVVQIGKQIAAGLAAAHQEGVIHRDVKPANILLENGCNRVVISDFGLAQVESDISLTRTGFIAGTPFYMSPEQAQGKVTDARSDLFALGGVLFFMATGRPPFTANHAMAVLNKICKEPLTDVRTWNPSIPSALANLIHTLLEKHADHRFRDATQVTQVLTDYLAHLQQPTAKRKPKVAPPKSMQKKRRWILAASLGSLAALVCIGLVVGNQLIDWNPDKSPNSKTEVLAPTLSGVGDTDQEFANRVNSIEKEIQGLETEPLFPELIENRSVDHEISQIESRIRALELEERNWGSNPSTHEMNQNKKP